MKKLVALSVAMFQDVPRYDMPPEVLQAACKLLQIASKRSRDIDLFMIERAIIFAEKAHRGQYRASGEHYIMHPIAVATIIAEQRFDAASIMTALLHDVVENTALTCADISMEFSNELAALVDGVTKLQKIDYKPTHVRQAEDFRKFLLALSKDVRVLLVKLADRIHNMQTLSSFPRGEKFFRIARETIEVYAPLAERVGMDKFKDTLEDLVFAAIHPNIRNTIKNKLRSLVRKDRLLLDISKKELTDLMRSYNVEAKVFGRRKTPYSIWKKMEDKGISFEKISDILALRIIVDSVEDCYKVLGLIHVSYKVVASGFVDYISSPKPNGYKSLHTHFIASAKHQVEVQIRTQEMDEIANFGLAAHWAYKSKVLPECNEEKLRWVTELIEVLRNDDAPQEFLKNAKMELYDDQVFCFKVSGELIALPKRATPVDFAFAINANIGLTCVGAIVNGEHVKLNTCLENGDKVEIITSPNSSPSLVWESFVVSAKAKNGIRKFIKDSQLAELTNLGRVLLIQALKENEQFYNERDLLGLLKNFHKKNVEELLYCVGSGTLSKAQVVQALRLKADGVVKKQSRILSSIDFIREHLAKSKPEKDSPLQGVLPDWSIKFANCCGPLPGDNIIGVMRNQEVVVHTANCNIFGIYTEQYEKRLNLNWKVSNGIYVGKVMILVVNQIGSLAQVTQCLHELCYNIWDIRVLKKRFDLATMLLEIELKNLQQLHDIISHLQKLPIVHRVERFMQYL